MSSSPERPTRIPALVELDAFLKRMAAHYAGRIPAHLGYAPTDLASRLTQRFAQLFEAAFVLACQGPERRAGRLPLNGDRADLTAGTVTLSAAHCVRLYLDFLARWAYTLLTVLVSIRLRPARARATLVFGIGLADVFRGGDDRAFLEYCRRGPIAPLRDARHLIVQATALAGQSTASTVRYARSPLHALFRAAGLTPREAARATGAHVVALARLTGACSVLPTLLLVARDFGEEALAAALQRIDAIEAVVLTTSNYSAQPLWTWARAGRAFRVHLIWYSLNIRPLLRKGDPHFPVNPVNRLIRADTMWVWLPSFADYLTGIGIRAEMRCVGPILWILPPEQAPELRGRPVIAVFDVVPTTEAEDRRLGFVDNYYTPANVRRFVEDIVEAARLAAEVSGALPRIELKHKRDERGGRDPGYFQFVDELAESLENFAVLPAETSIYEMVARCHVAIVLPCSSPVYAASRLGKPSIYYDPSGELTPVYDPAPGLEFIADRAQLAAAIARILGRRNGNGGG